MSATFLNVADIYFDVSRPLGHLLTKIPKGVLITRYISATFMNMAKEFYLVFIHVTTNHIGSNIRM